MAVCIVLNWLGDSLDGTLARVRQQQRPRYGFYVDHVSDIFGSAALMGGLAYSGLLHWQTAIAMLIAFLLLSGESYLATYTLSRFELSQGLFGPTEIRILLIVGTLALCIILTQHYSDTRCCFSIWEERLPRSVCSPWSIVVTLRHTAELYRQEPLP